MYDYKFINAKIVDGTGNPWFRGEIGVKDGKIVSVSKNLEGESLHVIDAKHQIVCPGFIDVHTHDDLAVISNPDHEPKLFQGVTSEVLANCGFGCAPVNKLTRKQLLQYISPVLGTYSREWGWKSFKEYVSVLSERSTSMNLVSQVAHGAVRIAVMGFESRPATSQEIEEMKALVEEAMQAGAIGLSLGLLYAPGCYAVSCGAHCFVKGGCSIWRYSQLPHAGRRRQLIGVHERSFRYCRSGGNSASYQSFEAHRSQQLGENSSCA